MPECPKCDCRRSLEVIRRHDNGDTWWYCTGCSWLVLASAAGVIVRVCKSQGVSA